MTTNVTHGLPARCYACQTCGWTRYNDDPQLGLAHVQHYPAHRVLAIETTITVIEQTPTPKAKVSDSE